MAVKKIFLRIVLLCFVLSYLSLFGCSHYSNDQNSDNQDTISRSIDEDSGDDIGAFGGEDDDEGGGDEGGDDDERGDAN